MVKHTQDVGSTDALVQMLTLISVSDLHSQPVGKIFPELASCIAKGNYIFQVIDEEVVGFATWIKLNRPLSEIFVNNVRPIIPMEHNTGEYVWLAHFVCGLGDPKKLLHHLTIQEDLRNICVALNGQRINLVDNFGEIMKVVA